jgi:hypothetical protein
MPWSDHGKDLATATSNLTGCSSIEKKRNNYFSNEPAAIASFSKNNCGYCSKCFRNRWHWRRSSVFSKKIGRDGSLSRQYLAKQVPLSVFLLTLAGDLKPPAQTPFFAIIKPDSGKYVNVWDPFLDPFPGFILPWTFAEAAPKKC